MTIQSEPNFNTPWSFTTPSGVLNLRSQITSLGVWYGGSYQTPNTDVLVVPAPAPAPGHLPRLIHRANDVHWARAIRPRFIVCCGLAEFQSRCASSSTHAPRRPSNRPSLSGRRAYIDRHSGRSQPESTVTVALSRRKDTAQHRELTAGIPLAEQRVNQPRSDSRYRS